jgi:hypothetical protein
MLSLGQNPAVTRQGPLAEANHAIAGHPSLELDDILRNQRSAHLRGERQ